MQTLNRKTKELVEATLIIGVARGEGVNNSSHDDKKDKIKGSIDNLTNRQIEITKQTAIDFLEWTEKGMWSKFESRTDGLHLMDGWYNTHNYAAMKQPLTSEQLFEQFEKQYTEPCNGNCGMNYCDENGCLENKPKSDGEDVAVVSV
jgi:hypothetical protein